MAPSFPALYVESIMSKQILLCAVGGLAAVAAGLSGTPIRSEPPDPMSIAPRPVVLEADLAFGGTAIINTGMGGDPTTLKVTLQGRLTRRVQPLGDRTTDTVWIVREPQFGLWVNGRPDPALTRSIVLALRRPVRVRADAAGAVSGIFVASGTHPVAAGLFRSLVLASQVAPVGRSGGPLVRSERDPDLLAGAHLTVRYEKSGRVLRRRHIRLEPPRRKWGQERDLQFRATFADSGEFCVERASGQVESGAVVLASRVRRGKELVSAQRVRFVLQARPVQTAPSLGELAAAGQWTQNAMEGANFAGAERDLHRRTLGGETLFTLTRSLERAAGPEQTMGLNRKWRSLLALEPERTAAAGELALRCRGHRLAVLGPALAETGTPLAQEMLLRLYRQRRGDPDSLLVLNCLAGVETPAPETIALFTQLARNDDSEGQAAALALGILAQQWSDDDPKSAQCLVEQLLDQAADPRRSLPAREAALLGVGNSACPAARAALLEFTSDRHRRLAIAATEALRRMPGPEVTRRLRALAHHGDPNLRRTARQAAREQAGIVDATG